MSTISSPSRASKDPESLTKSKPRLPDVSLEARLNKKDLEALKDAFMREGDGYDDRLSLTKDQFSEALGLILTKGTKEEYDELFNKIDVTKEGFVDWDKFSTHMLLEFQDKDDKVKATQVPQWKELRTISSKHKDVIQGFCYLKNNSKYIAISKEGQVCMWSQQLKMTLDLKAKTDSCRTRDLWVTSFVPLQNLNKIALAFTSKDIVIYDLSSKPEFNTQFKIYGLNYTPLSLDFWSDPNDPNEAVLIWGDTGGYVNTIHFTSANIALFERPSRPAGEKQDTCLEVNIKDVAKHKFKTAVFVQHHGHTEWVRQVMFSDHLECVISCASTWNDSLVIGWLERHATTPSQDLKTTKFEIAQGVNSFAYCPPLNLIATAGVNHHVCLWNPYVDSKPNGVLRGHMASVLQVCFNNSKLQLMSFSKDKVLRIWDVQLQVCIQRLAGIFPKGPEVDSALFFDERTSRLFLTFNYTLTFLEMKPEIKDRVMTHEKPVVAAMYNSTFNQIVTVSQDGTMTIWMVDTGLKVKSFSKIHGDSEVTCLAQDLTETRIYTGSADGTVKMWDFNGYCYHILDCGTEEQAADVGQILALKRTVLAVGWTKYITVFRTQNFHDLRVEPADWKGGQEHSDDILCMAFGSPILLATGSYDGEITIWNNNSEQASRHLRQRWKKKSKSKSFAVSRESTRASADGTPSFITQPSEHRSVKSRATSKLSALEDPNEESQAVMCLNFLHTRKNQTSAANLVSCGSNGWVRFWNTHSSSLVAEFIAHKHVGSILMNIDKDERFLATADVDGMIKTWDISEYCLDNEELDLITEPPLLIAQFIAHNDMITSISLLERNQCVVTLSSASDCSVALHDIFGNKFGVFGQEDHWKIEPYVPPEETEEEVVQDEKDSEIMIETSDDDWEPEEGATNDPANYRFNTWKTSAIGKGYQELRVQKRQRRQPGIIPELPYLHWEKNGDPPAGPYGALDTPSLTDVETVQKPDFMVNPNKYFLERSKSSEKLLKQPDLAESLRTAFDEKSLFPKYILDYEVKMKQQHSKSLQDLEKKASHQLVNKVVKSNNETPLANHPPSPGKRSQKTRSRAGYKYSIASTMKED